MPKKRVLNNTWKYYMDVAVLDCVCFSRVHKRHVICNLIKLNWILQKRCFALEVFFCPEEKRNQYLRETQLLREKRSNKDFWSFYGSDFMACLTERICFKKILVFRARSPTSKRCSSLHMTVWECGVHPCWGGRSAITCVWDLWGGTRHCRRKSTRVYCMGITLGESFMCL